MKIKASKVELKALIAGLLLMSTAHACPPGTIVKQGIGWQGCAPVPGTSSSSSSTGATPAIWADRWGAIAIDLTPGGAGISSSSGMKNKKKAENTALSSCKKKGGKRCEIEISYYNQCAVIVLGNDAVGSSSAASLDGAMSRGIDRCIQAGDKNCKIYFSECSFPERIR